VFIMSKEKIRSFYDRFGAKQDWQRFYEGPAIRDLFAHGAFKRAHAVFELGCGTGALAENLLTRYLSREATYLCFDISSTMVSLAKMRLNKYGSQAEIRLTNGSVKLPLPDSRFDRFISNYVLDLLPPEDIEVVMHEAHRVLEPEGRLCLISLTYGNTVASQLVIWLWKRIFGFHPSLVGGCRPVKLLDFISEKTWKLLHHNLVTTFGIPSEVIVARKASL
jgi:ubiquinone/menaquinone biosynthesis C-methylase UbiE